MSPAAPQSAALETQRVSAGALPATDWNRPALHVILATTLPPAAFRVALLAADARAAVGLLSIVRSDEAKPRMDLLLHSSVRQCVHVRATFTAQITASLCIQITASL